MSKTSAGHSLPLWCRSDWPEPHSRPPGKIQYPPHHVLLGSSAPLWSFHHSFILSTETPRLSLFPLKTVTWSPSKTPLLLKVLKRRGYSPVMYTSYKWILVIPCLQNLSGVPPRCSLILPFCCLSSSSLLGLGGGEQNNPNSLLFLNTVIHPILVYILPLGAYFPQQNDSWCIIFLKIFLPPLR